MKNLEIVIPLNPTTKKNSNQIIYTKRNGKKVPMVIPSKKYRDYEKQCKPYLEHHNYSIERPINLKCEFYRKDKRRVDLVGLLQAIQDIMVKYKVIKDDNHKIVYSTDGSSVSYDKENPRTEITITPL
jgi:Holliday junction resolvase RusA-like endonuclease